MRYEIRLAITKSAPYRQSVMYSSEDGIIDFNKKKRTLSDDFITKGRNLKEEVNQIRTFTG